MSGSSRRAFVKRLSMGVGTAALASAGAVWPARSAPAYLPHLGRRKPADKLGFALVGLGNYATNQLAPALLETQNAYLAGIVTGTPEKETVWAEKYDIPAANIYNYETFDRIADNPDIDVVYVVLPNSMHAEYVIRAAEAGKHVMCEKPMAVSAQECADMVAACRLHERKLAIGYRSQFHPLHQEAMRLGQEQVFGPVKLIEAGFGFRIGDPTQWRLRHAMAGGGALMDVGIYAIQAARYVTGEEPVSISAQEVKTDPVKFREVDETLTWQMKFPGGVLATCATSYSTNFNRLHAMAEGGSFTINSAYGYNGHQMVTSEGPFEPEPANMFAAQMDDFVACIENDAQSRVSGEEGLRDMKVIEAIYESIRTGREVALL